MSHWDTPGLRPFKDEGYGRHTPRTADAALVLSVSVQATSISTALERDLEQDWNLRKTENEEDTRRELIQMLSEIERDDDKQQDLHIATARLMSKQSLLGNPHLYPAVVDAVLDGNILSAIIMLLGREDKHRYPGLEVSHHCYHTKIARDSRQQCAAPAHAVMETTPRNSRR